MTEDEKKEWRETVTDLIITIGEQLDIEKNDQILMMMYLNTPRKIMRFVDWARERTVDNRILSTPAAVMHAVSQIERGDEILD